MGEISKRPGFREVHLAPLLVSAVANRALCGHRLVRTVAPLAVPPIAIVMGLFENGFSTRGHRALTA
jgi:hypothetical protein